jgi:hypothetical protein
MTVHDGIELARAFIWPFTVILLVIMLYRPAAGLLLAIGERASKVKIFQFEVELAKLAKASESLSTTVVALRQAEVQQVRQSVEELKTKSMVYGLVLVGITRSTADYVPVELGDDKNSDWLTSRLFMLATLLDRNRAVRCIVFTGEHGTFIGAATPRDIRWELGAKFPEYERALSFAHGFVAPNFALSSIRNGEFSEDVLNSKPLPS